MRRRSYVIALLIACSRPGVHELAGEADAIAVAHAPALGALVARIGRLKRGLRGNRPAWESMLRVAELANDALGLPPFTQTVPPGPAWRPSPASLLGIAPYVHERAHDLAARGDRDALEHLVTDERDRYERGIADVDANLAVVERWLASI